ncbi:MAG: alpha/beta hydrolase fold domain-containing protein [Algibacter sp.]
MKKNSHKLNYAFLLFVFIMTSNHAQDLSTFIAGGEYYIDNVGDNKRLKSNNADNDAITANTTDTGWRGYWEFKDAGNGYVYIDCFANGKRLQGLSNAFNETSIVLADATFTGDWVKWKLTKTGDNWFIDNKGHNTRLNVNSNSEISFGNIAWGAAFSQWKITDRNIVTNFKVDSHSPNANNATQLGINESITLTFNDDVNLQETSNIDVYINKILANNTISWSSSSSTVLSVNHNSSWTAGDLITIRIDPSIESEAGITYNSDTVEYEFIVDTPEDFGLERIRIEPLVTRNNGAHSIPLQVALPTDRSNKVPVHIWVHGGGWSGGTTTESSTSVSPHSDYLAEELGIATLEIAYRTIGSNGTFTLALEDIESAYQWAISNASTYNFDLDKIFLSGGSAGTPLASLFSQEHDDIKAFVGFNGIYNFSQNPGSSFPFGGSSVYEFCVPSCAANSSIFNLRNNPPATLLLHGDNDTTINHTQSTLFEAAINNAGGNARTVIYPGEPHAFFNTGRVQFEDCLWEMANFLKNNNLFQTDTNTTQTYYIDNVGANQRLKSNNADTDVISTSVTDNNSRTYWEFIDAGSGYVYIQCLANGMRLQGMSSAVSNESSVRLGDGSFSGDWVKWKLIPTGNNKFFIQNKGHNTRLNVLSNDAIAVGASSWGGTFVQWTITNRDTNTASKTSSKNKTTVLDESVNVEKDLNIYPNPVKSGNNFYLNYNSTLEGKHLEIRISNISGSTVISQKTITSKDFKSYEVSTGNLLTGLYFIELISNGETIVIKKLMID